MTKLDEKKNSRSKSKKTCKKCGPSPISMLYTFSIKNPGIKSNEPII